MYRIVVYWRWDKGVQSADCFWCVPWPDMTDEEFENEKRVLNATIVLSSETGVPAPDSKLQDMVLTNLGFKEAVQMLRELPLASFRCRFNQMEREIFTSTEPVTRREIEQIKLNRRK